MLPRLLLRSIELLRENLPLLNGAFELLRAFSEDEVLQATGVHGCLLASKCLVALLELWQGDILLWGQGRPEGGLCHFFLQRGHVLYVAFEQLQLQSCRPEEYVFRKTEHMSMLCFADMQHHNGSLKKTTASSACHEKNRKPQSFQRIPCFRCSLHAFSKKTRRQVARKHD